MSVQTRLRLTALPILMGLIVAVIGAGFHLIQVYGQFRQLKHSLDGSPNLGNLNILFTLAFALCMVGVILRSRLGLIISILSLGCVLFLYAKWYEFSYRLWKLIREFSPSPDFVPSHPLGLLYASWLDIAILFAVVIVLASQVKFLISTFRHRNGDN